MQQPAASSPAPSRQPVPPQQPSNIDNLLKTLTENTQRDDAKLCALREIWTMFDIYSNSPAYAQALDALYRAFFKLFVDTNPQFIQENNTQQLRKLVLEIMLRTSSHEVAKRHTCDTQKLMLRLIKDDNEDNGCLALKILVDHVRTFRIHQEVQIRDIASIVQHFRNAFFDMHKHIADPKMFELLKPRRPTQPMQEDALIAHYLLTCFYPQKVYFSEGPHNQEGQPKEPEYFLIPRASQSLKLLSEMALLFILIYHHYKTQIVSEISELMKAMISFTNLTVPVPPFVKDQRNTVNSELRDEFFNCQMKTLNFVAFIAKSSPEAVFANSPQLLSGIFNLLDTCPAEMVQARRELLMAVKYFYTSDFRDKFRNYVARLFSEKLMVGTGYTCQDTIRPMMYSINADLLHHLRLQLSYPILVHTIFVYSRCIHDISLPANLQSMCVRLMMNLCEAFGKLEKEQEAPGRDILFNILETCNMKLKVLAYQHMPLLFKQHGNGMEWRSDVENITVDKEKNESKTFLVNDVVIEDGPWDDIMPTNGDAYEVRIRRSSSSVDSVAELESPEAYYADERVRARMPPPLPEEKPNARGTSVQQLLHDVWAIPAPPLNLNDCRNMIKYLIQCAKYVLAQLIDSNLKRTQNSLTYMEERDIFSRFFKYGLICLDVFMLPITSGRNNNVRTKDERECIDSFANVFANLNPDVYQEIFSNHIEFLIERISRNFALQLICNSFLVNPTTSARFGGILVHYLLERLPQMSVNTHRSGLHLKLYKLMFSAVSCAQSSGCADIEKMLRPYMHDLVSQAMKLALTSKDPQNYFYLLRALFRSIGGGAHDMLYVQFLPLLPDLLKKLNRLQSSAHRQIMRELFTELCLTIPVRLSSLLPYLSLLMDPLVSALNGSTSLMQQGLRTLELCVDNLQPEYLYEHMGSVRPYLIEGLWKRVGCGNDFQSSTSALRILGKLGGSNRKVLVTPQRLQVLTEDDLKKFYLVLDVDGRTTIDRNSGVDLETLLANGSLQNDLQVHIPLPKLMPRVIELLKNASGVEGSSTHPVPNYELRNLCAEWARSIILLALSPTVPTDFTPGIVEEIRNTLRKMENISDAPAYICRKNVTRQVYVNALTALFFVIVGKDLRPKHLKLFNAVVKQLTLQSLMELIAKDELMCAHPIENCMDSAILVDAFIATISDISKEFVKSAFVALRHILDVYLAFIEDLNQLAKMPFLKYLLEQVCKLCHADSWFSRVGGATALYSIIGTFPQPFLVYHISLIIQSLLETQFGLQDEVSQGAIDMALAGLHLLHKKCLPNFQPNDELARGIVTKMVLEYSRQLFNPDAAFRRQVHGLLHNLAKHTNLPLETLFVPIKQHVRKDFDVAIERFGGDSMHAQIATMGTFTFLFAGETPFLDMKEDEKWPFAFLERVMWICAGTEESLLEDPLYRMLGPSSHFPHDLLQRIVPLRQSAAECLVACLRMLHKIRLTSSSSASQPMPKPGELIEQALRLLGDKQEKVQLATRDALQRYHKSHPIPPHLLQEAFNRVLIQLDELVTDVNLRHLCHFVYIENGLVNAKVHNIAEKQLIAWNAEGRIERGSHQIYSLYSLSQLLNMSPLFNDWFVDPLCRFLTLLDYDYVIDKPLDFERIALKFLCKFPRETLRFFLKRESVICPARRALMRRFLKSEDSAPIKDVATQDEAIFSNMLQGRMLDDVNLPNGAWQWLPPLNQTEQLYSEYELMTLTLIDRCSRDNVVWYADAHRLVEQLRELWVSPEFKIRHLVKSDNFNHHFFPEAPEEANSQNKPTEQIPVRMLHITKYKVPKLLVTCLIRYLRTNYTQIEILFDTMSCFVGNYATDFTFVRTFLEQEVIPKYPLEWIRNAFFKVMDRLLEDPTLRMKSLDWVKVIQYLLIPCLQYTLERYDVDAVVGPLCLQETQAPGSTDSTPMEEHDPYLLNQNMVARLEKVLTKCQDSMSARMTVVIFQLATVFVKFAPHHIHDNASKKQGARLRSLMLLGWPYLNQPSQDITIKYSAHLFLAHIIEKFAINRKIVLQVYHSLMAAYHIDNRDVVKHAIDIITPAVPVRMDDGYYQLLSTVRRILLEETHNATHAYYCIYVVCRNYRVFYYVRHELLTSLLGTLTKLFQQQAGGHLEGKKLAVEVCEIAIKWELLRNQKVQERYGQSTGAPSQDGDEVDGLLEKLKGEPEPDVREEDVKREVVEPGNGTPLREGHDPQLPKEHQPLAKEHVEQVISLLLRMAVHYSSSSQSSSQQSNAEITKKSFSLLRAALKPRVWGSIAMPKISWLERQLIQSIEAYRKEGNQAQAAQAAHILEVLVTLIQIMPPPLVVQTVQSLQAALSDCMLSNNTGLVRAVNALVKALLEKTRSSEKGLDQFDELNTAIYKHLHNQLFNYEKSQNASIQTIYTGFSLLRIIGLHQPDYIKAQIGIQLYAKVIQKMGKEHQHYLQMKGEKEKGMSDLFEVAVDLLRPHVSAIPDENKRHLLAIIGVNIEKTDQPKVAVASLNLLHDIVASLGENLPSPMMQVIARLVPISERRFKDAQAGKPLFQQFLSTVLIIFSHKRLRDMPEAEKLLPAFAAGLNSSDETIRTKFLEAWDRERDRCVIDRIRYLFGVYNWAPMRDTFWLKHVLYMLLKSSKKTLVAQRCQSEEGSGFASLWNTLAATTGLAGRRRRNFESGLENRFKEEPMEVDDLDKEEGILSDKLSPPQQREAIFKEVSGLLTDAINNTMVDPIDQLLQLIFNIQDTRFVAQFFQTVFISLWQRMSVTDRQSLETTLCQFISSSRHGNPTQPGHPSVLTVLIDTFTKCGIHIPPAEISYVANYHTGWHRAVLLLEEMAEHSPRLASVAPMLQYTSGDAISQDLSSHLSVLNRLDSLYEHLHEFDQKSVIWSRRALLPYTSRAMDLYLQGKYQAAVTFIDQNNEMWLDRLKQTNSLQCTIQWEQEQEAITDIWKKSLFELCDWERLDAYGKAAQNPEVLMKISPHLSDWSLLRDCVAQIGACVPRNLIVSHSLHQSLLNVMAPELQPKENQAEYISHCTDELQKNIVDEWRKLPTVIDASHVPLLQAMNIVQEINESAPVKHGIYMAQQTAPSAQTVLDIKNIVKTWRNRVGCVSDSYSSTVFAQHFRLNIHADVVRAFDIWEKKLPQPAFQNQQMLPIHSSAQAQLAIAQGARKRKLYDFAEESLLKLHTLPSLPLLDAQSTVLEQLKLYRTMASDPEIQEGTARELLGHALALCERAPLEGQTKELLCKIFAQKGRILSKLGRGEDADKAFMTAANIQEVAVNNKDFSAFYAWGKHLDDRFHARRNSQSALAEGREALTCFLDAARIDNEGKAGKSIARFLFTLKCMEALGDTMIHDAIDALLRQCTAFINPSNWLQWLPSLCDCIRERSGSSVFAIIARVAKMHPIQTFYVIRGLLPAEAIDKICARGMTPGQTSVDPTQSADIIANMPIKPWQRTLVHALDIVLEQRPSAIRALHRILQSLSNIPEYWAERQLRESLEVLDMIKRRLASSRFKGFSCRVVGNSLIERVERWSQLLTNPTENVAYLEEKGGEWMASQEDFDEDEWKFRDGMTKKILDFCRVVASRTSLLPSLGLINGIRTLLLKRLKALPSTVILNNIDPWLANFSSRTADVELFSELFTTKPVQYLSMITRFDSRVHVQIRAGRPVKMIEVRTHTGKTTSWLIQRDPIDRNPEEPNSLSTDASAARLAHFYTQFNNSLRKDTETSKRFLNLHVPTRLEIASRCSLVQIPATSSSLIQPIDVMAKHFEPIFMEPDDLIDFFYKNLVADDVNDVNPERMHTAMYNQFTEHSQSMIPDSVFQKHIAERLPDPTQYYALRKQFSKQLGLISLLELSLGVGAFWLEDMNLCESSCLLWHSNSKLYLPPPSATVEIAPPFRFTPNLQKFIGFSREGHLRWAMHAARRCIELDQIRPFLNILFFDEVAEISGRSNVQFFERYITQIEERIRRLTSPEENTQEDAHSRMINESTPQQLSRADPSWHPWF